MLVRRIRRKCGILAGLDLITKLFFATGLCNPRGIATGGPIGAELGLPRRRLDNRGLNYHMLRHGPTGVHHAGGTKGPAHRRHKLCQRKRAALAGTPALAPVASTEEASTANWPSKAYTKEAAVLARSAASSYNVRAAPHGNGGPAYASHRSIVHASAVYPAFDQATVDHQQPSARRRTANPSRAASPRLKA